MKVAGMEKALLIGDVHAEDVLLSHVLQFGRNRGIHDVLCTGDFCDGSGDVDACVALAKRSGMRAVMGNHDEWCVRGQVRTLPDATAFHKLGVETQTFLKQLTPTITFRTAAGNAILCHGLMRHTMAKVNEGDYGYAIENNFELQEFLSQNTAHILLNGHTHRRMVMPFGNKVIVNAGTLFRAHQPCFGIIDFKHRMIAFHEVSLEGAIVEADIRAF